MGPRVWFLEDLVDNLGTDEEVINEKLLEYLNAQGLRFLEGRVVGGRVSDPILTSKKIEE